MNLYEIDTAITVTSAFAQINGTAIDPTTVTLFIKDPTGVEQTIAMGALTHTGTGAYSYTFTPTIAGVWSYKFQGAGNVAVTTPDVKILVQSSRLIAG